MDKNTRNNIQRATQAGRTILERAFSDQLEGTFDILLDGTIAEQAGSHLNDRQKVVREKLVATMAHKRSTGMSAQDAVQAYLREAAFTTLNRFVALKMLEARGLVQECISKGEDSSGFKEFKALAPGLVAIADKGYRLYIETLFDEIGQEVNVLFDRHDVASLLWPDRQTLLELLSILNSSELANVWAEDETIGWVYQYFNSDEDIRSARYDEDGKSKAPLNSRELAVRNQFFTPRYVVQLLTDNTLGRTWYEMMQGETKLANLDYLVRRSNEVFLADELSIPVSEVEDSGLSQEKLLHQKVYVPFRPKKDPRDLRILDPACGSGHFLLYAFEMLISIYEEAWNDVEAVAFTETGTKLRNDFSNIEELRLAIPELILRHNLHGVDIDPRAAQIAALALWMRAQRAYHEFDIVRAARPPITKTNIVLAEPIPGDTELVEAFAGSLNPPVLGDLFKKMVEEMKLAGGLGSLLRVEETIAKAITTTRNAFAEHQNTLNKGFLPGFEPDQGEHNFTGIDDETFFEEAEVKIIAVLSRFTEFEAGRAGVRRKLFAGDAAQGLAFIQLMRKRFDVVLMNPPFGEPTSDTGGLIGDRHTCGNLFCGFVTRGYQLSLPTAMIGAITDRSFVVKRSYQPFRQWLYNKFAPREFTDLGWDVLNANVEACAYTIAKGNENNGSLFANLTSSKNPANELVNRIDCLRSQSSNTGSSFLCVSLASFSEMPFKSMAYWLPIDLLSEFAAGNTLSLKWAKAARGMSSGKTAFACRLLWEVPTSDCGSKKRWNPVNVGGGKAPFFRSPFMVFYYNGDWGPMAAFPGFSLKNLAHYWKPAIGWGKRTDVLTTQLLSGGMITAEDGQVLSPYNPEDIWLLLGCLNSNYAQASIHAIAGGHKEPGSMDAVPLSPEITGRAAIEQCAQEGYFRLREIACYDETSPYFTGLGTLPLEDAWSSNLLTHIEDTLASISKILITLNDLVFSGLGKNEAARIAIQDVGPPPLNVSVEWPNEGAADLHIGLMSFGLGRAFGRWCVPANDAEIDWDPLADTPVKSVLLENDPNKGADVLVDDPGDDSHIIACIKEQIISISKHRSESIFKACEDALNPKNPDLRLWMQTKFFPAHIKRYSRSRRKAPIYWQLATQSASYSVWCYYHRLTRDTFFRVANDYVAPKVDHEERKLNVLRQEAGPDPSSKQRKAIDAQENFVAELRTFKTEVNRIAPMWNPNLNDGVIINFAPLWRLVPQNKPWQKECKKVWDKLVKGDYDWAHLAMHLWPERVVPKCQDDRSLAIVHGLENELWYKGDDAKWKKRNIGGDGVADLVAERSSIAVRAALKDLLEAPAPAGGSTRRKRRTKS